MLPYEAVYDGRKGRLNPVFAQHPVYKDEFWTLPRPSVPMITQNNVQMIWQLFEQIKMASD